MVLIDLHRSASFLFLISTCIALFRLDLHRFRPVSFGSWPETIDQSPNSTVSFSLILSCFLDFLGCLIRVVDVSTWIFDFLLGIRY